MAYIDDAGINSEHGFEVVKKVGKREIRYAIHDIDGTHSLIRDWQPTMSITIHHAMTCGLEEGFDSDKEIGKLIKKAGTKPISETDKFCIESAGLSALTQMEFGIRRAIQENAIPVELKNSLTKDDHISNSEIVKRIWNGEERFNDLHESTVLTKFIEEKTPRLFKMYESVLNGACRDKNTAEAWDSPEKWRVPGSLEFIQYLQSIGIVNYFVTGAVIYEEGGMYEEVKSLRYEIGKGKTIEALVGSSWDQKQPKDEVMKKLFRELMIDPKEVLIVGDGRTEISSGVSMGCVVMSRLPSDSERLRQMHIGFGTNFILDDYRKPVLFKIFQRG